MAGESQSAGLARPPDAPQQTVDSGVHSNEVLNAGMSGSASRRQSERASLHSNTITDTIPHCQQQNADSAAATEEAAAEQGFAQVFATSPGNGSGHITPAHNTSVPSSAEDVPHRMSAHLRQVSETPPVPTANIRRESKKTSRRQSTNRTHSRDGSYDANGKVLASRRSSKRKSSTRRTSQADHPAVDGELLPAETPPRVVNAECNLVADRSQYLDRQRQPVVGGEGVLAAESYSAEARGSKDGTFGATNSEVCASVNPGVQPTVEIHRSLEERQQAHVERGSSWLDDCSNSRPEEHFEAEQHAPPPPGTEQDIIPGQIQDEDTYGFQSQLQVVVPTEEAPLSFTTSETADPRLNVNRNSVLHAAPDTHDVGNRREGHPENDITGQNVCQRPTAHPTVRVVVTADAEEKESRGYAKRPTFFQSMLKDGEVDFGPSTTRLDKIRVVSFSGGRVFDALHLEENCIFVKDKKKFVPLDQLKAFIRIMVEDMEKMKRQSIDAITEMEWNFRILDQKTKKRCEMQVNAVKSRALDKLDCLRKKVIEYKTQMEFFESQYHQLKEAFEDRVRKFKEQMPKDLQELDARWGKNVAELQKVLQTTQTELDRSLKLQEEVGAKINRILEELNKAEASSHHPDEAGLLEKMNDLHAVIRKVVEENTKEQVALVVAQLVGRVEVQQQEKRLFSLEKENGTLKDLCGDGLQRRMAEYEKEISDLQAACKAAESGACASGGATYEEIEKLRNELTVLSAENMILRRKVHGGGGAAATPTHGALTGQEGEIAGGGSGADPSIIQELTLTVEDLERQIMSLKGENEQLQAQLIMSEESASKGGKGAGDSAGARLVQQLQQKNKMLEAQVEPMKKKIRELEVAQKRGGGAEADQRVRELEMKLKDAEVEARKQQRQMELELHKSSKGTGLEMRKLEDQVQKLTERASEVEAALETTSKELKETKKERDGLKKEADALRQQVGQAQEIISEVQTLRAQTKEQQIQMNELENSYKQEKSLRKKYYNEIEDMKGKIRVYCRIRPMAKYELEKNCKQSVHPVDEYSVKVQTAKGDKEFMFDRTFPPECSQEAVYEDTQRLIQSVIDGFNVCIFAYGQTGSGKTFTIQGNASFPGVAPRAITDLFDTLESYDKHKFVYTVDVYMCELYNNQLVDLLLPDDKKKAPPALDIKKDVTGMVTIPGITLRKVANKAELSKIFAYGLEARHVSGTAMNAESSRSHLIFSVIVTLEDKVAGKRANGKLSLIDLAGSERVSKSGATKERLVEAREINKSLSALGDVISALSSGEPFIPYRNHKLTQLMSDSLGGTAKTLMFVNVSPADYNTDETVTSLMYASRVKLITNDATKQVESKQLATMKDTIKNLTLIIEKLRKGEDTSELEKQLNQGKTNAPEAEEPPPPEKPENEQDYDEPPDVPAD